MDKNLGAEMFPNAEHSTTYLEALWNFLQNAANENGCTAPVSSSDFSDSDGGGGGFSDFGGGSGGDFID